VNLLTGNVLIAAVCGAGVGVGLVLVIRSLAGVPVGPGGESKGRFGAWLERAKAPGATRKVLIALGAAAGVGAFTGWPVGAVLAGLAAWVLPGMFGKDTAAVREQARIEAIASWAEMMRDTLSAAAGLEQAVLATAVAAPFAIREEVAELAAALKTGARLEDALAAFGAALADPAGDLVVASLILSSRHQARNLTDVLSALAENARGQVGLRMRTAANRARTRTSIRIIVSTVLALGGGLVAFDRTYMAPYDSALGQAVLLFVAALFALSFAWLNKIQSGRAVPRFLTRVPSAGEGGRP
jgi:Flp pilus assembly protein TadB